MPPRDSNTLRRLTEAAAALSREMEEDRVRGPISTTATWPSVLAGTFPEQRAFITDQSTFKAAFCTRRAAKTYSVGLDFIEDARTRPFASYVFAGLTRESARNQFWDDVLKDIDRKFNIGIRFNESRLVAILPNGARIHLVGADSNEKEQRKLLGGKRRKICVDEAQDWKIDLRKFVMGTLSPSVADLRGQVMLTGTPGNLVTGYFHDVTNGSSAGKLSAPSLREPGWSVHTWTTFHNPYMAKQWEEQIEGLKASNPRVVEVPWFRQNYLGEWVIDLDARVYKFSLDRNAYRGPLPQYRGGQWHFGLGIDLGYSPDPSAFVLAAYHDWDPHLYFLHSWKQWQMDITDVAERVRWYDSKVQAEHHARMEFYVIDGANKQAVEEMRRRHQLDLLAADKTGKEDFIEIMNAEFILGNILVNVEECCDGVTAGGKESLALADEYSGLIWDPTVEKGKPRKEHPNCPNHLTDATLYAWRRCYPYLSKMPLALPDRGTAEWFAQEAERMRQQTEDQMRARIEADIEAAGAVGFSDGEDLEPWAR